MAEGSDGIYSAVQPYNPAVSNWYDIACIKRREKRKTLPIEKRKKGKSTDWMR